MAVIKLNEGNPSSVDSHKKEEVKYTNGVVCRDDSVDMDRVLDYQYGTDRDPDNSHYTSDEKQRALDYYIKKTEGDAPRKRRDPRLKESEDFSKGDSSNDSDLSGTIPGLIAQNNEGELDAIKGYEDLISCLKDTYPEYVPDIEEIIADEKNHVEVLNKILKELDGILPNKD